MGRPGNRWLWTSGLLLLFVAGGAALLPLPASWKTARHELVPGMNAVMAIAYGPTASSVGRLIITTHCPSHPAGARVQFVRPAIPSLTLWDELAIPLLHQECPSAVFPVARFTADGREFACAVRRGVMFWNIEDRAPRATTPVDGQVCAISSDVQWVAVRPLEQSAPLRVIHLETGEVVFTLPDDTSQGISTCEFSSDGTVLTSIQSHRPSSNLAMVSFWSLPAGRATGGFRVPEQALLAGTLSPDRSRFAQVLDSQVQVITTDRGTPVWEAPEHPGHIHATAFSPDGRLLAVAGEGKPGRRTRGETRVWDLQSGDLVAKMQEETSWGTTSVAFSPDGTELATGNSEGCVRFWAVPDSKAVDRVSK